jgi:hypothetical protein
VRGRVLERDKILLLEGNGASLFCFPLRATKWKYNEPSAATCV